MDTVTVNTERQVHASVETVRRTVQAALEQMAFAIDKSQGGLIEAHRGSPLKSGLAHGPPPLRASVSVMGHGETSRVQVHLADAESLSANPQMLCPTYQPLFYNALSDLDGWLLAVDPAMTVPPAPALEVHTGGPSYLRSKMATLARHLPGSYGESAAQALHPEVPLWVVAPDAAAVLTPDQVQMLLTVASMATASSDALPAAHARRIENLNIALLRAVENGRPPYERLDVSEVDMHALDFLHTQALIRHSLPVREVRQCRDCGFERVVNPDYRKQLQHNQTLQQLTGMVGLSVGTGGANVFALAGRLFNLNALHAKTIPCPRCEGTDADVSLATMCPQCREIRKEPILRVCRNRGCGYNFLERVANETLWGSPGQPSASDSTDTAIVQPVAIAASAAAVGSAVAVDVAAIPDPVAAPAEPETAMEPVAPPDWYDDPSERHQLRWFDGDWTEWAADDGAVLEDPL